MRATENVFRVYIASFKHDGVGEVGEFLKVISETPECVSDFHSCREFS